MQRLRLQVHVDTQLAKAHPTMPCIRLVDDEWKLIFFVLTTSEVAEDHIILKPTVTVLDTLMKEWGIRQAVAGTSTGNGSNIIKAVKEMVCLTCLVLDTC